MLSDDELDTVIEPPARGTAFDPFHLAAPIVDLLRRATSGSPPTPSPELPAILAGQEPADRELSPGAARATWIARRCLPAIEAEALSHHRCRSLGPVQAVSPAAKSGHEWAVTAVAEAAHGGEQWCSSLTTRETARVVDDHRAALAGLADWMPYLAAHSRLPGPRANLELVAACGEEADVSRAEQLVATGDEFAMVCGLVALGRHFGHGDDTHLDVLHACAGDERWRVREGVAMALQRAGDDDSDRAFAIAERWAGDPDPLVRRAAVAAVCEPRLLRDPAYARRALALLERVTFELAASPAAGRRSPGVRTLRQALGYGWSVAIAAVPTEGLATLARLEATDDADVAWIVRENKKKARLKRVLADHP